MFPHLRRFVLVTRYPCLSSGSQSRAQGDLPLKAHRHRAANVISEHFRSKHCTITHCLPLNAYTHAHIYTPAHACTDTHTHTHTHTHMQTETHNHLDTIWENQIIFLCLFCNMRV